MTYKLVLSLFPFLIFLLSLLGTLNIDRENLFEAVKDTIPSDILNIIDVFIKEVFLERHTSLMSFSILATIYSSSGGFQAVIRGINRSFSQTGRRSFLVNTMLSIAFVILFAIAIICSLICLIYGNLIVSFLSNFFNFPPIYISKFFKILVFVAIILLIFLTVCVIYKFALVKKVAFKSLIPGAIFTVIFWLISSKIYNIYIEKYANYSKIYGNIGGIFILLIWLNLISNLLLIGSEINSLLYSMKQKNINIKKNLVNNNFDSNLEKSDISGGRNYGNRKSFKRRI